MMEDMEALIAAVSISPADLDALLAEASMSQEELDALLASLTDPQGLQALLDALQD